MIFHVFSSFRVFCEYLDFLFQFFLLAGEGVYIRNGIVRYQSLEISYFWTKVQDSRPFQLATYTVFHPESESAVRNYQFLHPEEKKY